MSNQQVDDALSDYFTDLLGSAETVTDTAEDKAKPPIVEQIERDKLELTPIKALSDSVTGDAVTSNGKSIIHIPSIADKPKSYIRRYTST